MLVLSLDLSTHLYKQNILKHTLDKNFIVNIFKVYYSKRNSMFIKFHKLRFANVRSYGNSITELVFQNGLTNITGFNGAGKSTIQNA